MPSSEHQSRQNLCAQTVKKTGSQVETEGRMEDAGWLFSIETGLLARSYLHKSGLSPNASARSIQYTFAHISLLLSACKGRTHFGIIPPNKKKQSRRIVAHYAPQMVPIVILLCALEH